MSSYHRCSDLLKAGDISVSRNIFDDNDSKYVHQIFSRLEVTCKTIMESLHPVCQNSFAYAKLSDTLDTYKMHLKNSINAFINELHDMAVMINKGQLEKVGMFGGTRCYR